ncbi:MAG: thioredoxin-disulfide reductase [bacterium]
MIYDLIIIGGGPAGITASIYAARYKLNFFLASEILGGWLNEIHEIENYPGFKSISGFELIEKYKEQLQYLGAPLVNENIIHIEKENDLFKVITSTEKAYNSRTIIIASGSKKQTLNIPGEKEFLGRGVSYCAICDAMFFKEKIVAVVGGANSAVSAALHLAKIAKKVYLVYRKNELRAEKILVANLEKETNVEIIYDTNIIKINGNEKVQSVELDNSHKDCADKNILALDGIFIEIGLIPITELVSNIGVELDNKNQIKIDDKCRTNIKGAFAAGDVTNGQGELKQFVTAMAAGAIAATSANRYLKSQSKQ